MQQAAKTHTQTGVKTGLTWGKIIIEVERDVTQERRVIMKATKTEVNESIDSSMLCVEFTFSQWKY